MSPNAQIELTTPALPAWPDEPLLASALDLAQLGINEATPTGRLSHVFLQECLPDGSRVGVPSQFELVAGEQCRGILTWLASPRPPGPRRFVLAVGDPNRGDASPFPRVQVEPDVDDRVWITVDGRRVLGYCHSPRFHKPFFYPVIGPAGRSVTRLGHPRDFSGGHDHHRSLWIEHELVNGVSFETEYMRYFQEPAGRVVGIGRQVHRGFTEQTDGPVFAGVTVRIDWVSHTQETLLEEERRVCLFPLANGEQLIELVLTLRPRAERVTFGQSSYGILALRVARSIEAGRGGGRILNARGALNEAGCHLQASEWCDYSGPITAGQWNGIALFDHPDNPYHPPAWMTRNDGWMCAAPCYGAPITISPGQELVLRYRLYVHDGDDASRIAARYAEYAQPAPVSISPSG